MALALRWSVVLLATTALSGCASWFGAPSSSAPATSGFASGTANSPAASGVSSVPVLGSVVTAVKSGTTKLVSFATPAPAKPTADDPTMLSSKLGRVTPDLRVTMAQMQEGSGNLARAKEQYELALKENPRHLEALLGLAHLLDRQGKLDEAAVQYRLACKYHPNDPRALNDLGLCCARQGHYVDSAKMLSSAIERDPQKMLYRDNLSAVLCELGRYDEALAQLTAVHGGAIAHYDLGCLLYKKGDRRSAAQQFAYASAADPSFGPARQWSERLAALTPGPPAYSVAAGPPPQAQPPNVASLPPDLPPPPSTVPQPSELRTPLPGDVRLAMRSDLRTTDQADARAVESPYRSYPRYPALTGSGPTPSTSYPPPPGGSENAGVGVSSRRGYLGQPNRDDQSDAIVPRPLPPVDDAGASPDG